MRAVLVMTAMLALAACHGNPLQNGTSEPVTAPPPTDTSTPSATGAVSVPAALANNMVSAVYDPGTDTVKVTMAELDAPNIAGTYTRNAALDVPGFKAYSSQQSPLDRMFIALTATSADGSVSATVAGDGGQFNKYYSGLTYDRTVGGVLPTSGEAKFHGSYAGITNMKAAGAELLAVPAGTDPSLLPREALRTQGEVFLIANFADMAVNGSIYNRQLVGVGGLTSLALTPGAIDSNGQFTGKVQYTNRIDLGDQGDYGGVIGGATQSSVAGGIRMNSVYPSDDPSYDSNQRETGVFVLTNCSLTPSTPVCAASTP